MSLFIDFFMLKSKGKLIAKGFNGSPIPQRRHIDQMIRILTAYRNLTPKERKEINSNIRKQREEENNRCYDREYPPRPEIDGYVYLIHSQGKYKIGKTKDPKSRMKGYTAENPHGFEVIEMFKCKSYSKQEKEMHKIFQDKRIGNREWFNLDDKDVDKFKTLAETLTIQ